jgi:hypothetical protein
MKTSLMNRARWMTAVTTLAWLCFAANVCQGAPVVQRQWPALDQYLSEGRLAEGEAALAQSVEANPGDVGARYSLGIIQFVRGVETLVQSLHRHGLKPDPWGQMPMLRLPVPANLDPQPISYDQYRAILQTFADDLAKAEATLAGVDDPFVKVPVRFGMIRMDFDGNGTADENETLWRIYETLNAAAVGNWDDGEDAGVELEDGADDAQEPPAQAQRAFVIAFDAADVNWMRGYCHLLLAINEFYLAHDSREMFERTAHLFFPKVESPFESMPAMEEEFMEPIADMIAMVHLVNWEVTEPQRMERALTHLQAVIEQSRLSWQAILVETDDDREWVPSPNQTSVLPGVAVTEEMVQGWQDFLTEAEAILAGRTLVPHWRFADRGFNLRRVFTEPRKFDLVLWVQGSSAQPYVEDGPVTRPEFWMRMQNLFRGEFIGFAIWFN